MTRLPENPDLAPRPDGPVISAPLLPVVSDVTTALKESGIDSQGFIANLTDVTMFTVRGLQKAEAALTFIEGPSFQTLPDSLKRRRMTRIFDDNPYYVTQYLQGLEQTAQRDGRGRSMERFNEAVRVLEGYRDRGRIRSDMVFISDTHHVDIPTTSHISAWKAPDTSEYSRNSDAQANVARTIGTLGDSETWPDFLHRDTLIVVRLGDHSEADRLQEENPEATIGMPDGINMHGIKGDIVYFRGTPRFLYAPTKYPLVRASINIHADHGNVSRPGDKDTSLDQLLREGRATPSISLSIPTDYLVPLAS